MSSRWIIASTRPASPAQSRFRARSSWLFSRGGFGSLVRQECHGLGRHYKRCLLQPRGFSALALFTCLPLFALLLTAVIEFLLELIALAVTQ
jgi:hypothetical protein